MQIRPSLRHARAAELNHTIYRRSAGSVRVGVEPQIGGAAIRVTARW
jgi:hypothetical protein